MFEPLTLPGNYSRGTDEWWVAQLSIQIRQRNEGRDWAGAMGPYDHTPGKSGRPGLDLLWSYYCGEPPLPSHKDDWDEVMWAFLRMSRMNYAGMAVRSIAERLYPIGWQTAADGDADGDEEAARIAAVNGFDLEQGDLTEDMLWAGETYALVAPPTHDPEVATITTEDPRSCIVVKDRLTNRPMAALKISRDEWDGHVVKHLFLPGRVRVVRELKNRQSEWDLGLEGATLPDRIPLVPATNKGGVGEFERSLDVLDRIHSGIFDRIVISKYQAFKQRAVKAPLEDRDGNRIDYSGAFTTDPGAVWVVPPDTDFWESSSADLSAVRTAIRDDVEAFAQAVGVPVNWLSSDAANQTAAGSNNAQAGNQFRAEDRQRRLNAAYAEIFAQAFLQVGDTERGQAWKIKTLWKPVERYSITDMASADAQAVSLPVEERLTRFYQASPGDVQRIKQQLAAEALREAMNQQVVAAAQQAATPSAARQHPQDQPAPATGQQQGDQQAQDQQVTADAAAADA